MVVLRGGGVGYTRLILVNDVCVILCRLCASISSARMAVGFYSTPHMRPLCVVQCVGGVGELGVVAWAAHSRLVHPLCPPD